MGNECTSPGVLYLMVRTERAGSYLRTGCLRSDLARIRSVGQPDSELSSSRERELRPPGRLTLRSPHMR
jgi:hypothetical protein